MIYIGIDPDTEKSGVAIYNTETKEVLLDNLSFPQTLDLFNSYKEALFVIEKGENNKAIFNASRAKTKAIAAKIGSSVGKNFQVTACLIEYLEYFEFKVETFTPNKYTPKYNNKLAQSIIQKLGTRIYKEGQRKSKTTNEEQRDALRCLAKYV